MTDRDNKVSRRKALLRLAQAASVPALAAVVPGCSKSSYSDNVYADAPPYTNYADAGSLCDDTCGYAGDAECDDGGEGAQYSVCDIGTDCTDCGPRGGAYSDTYANYSNGYSNYSNSYSNSYSNGYSNYSNYSNVVYTNYYVTYTNYYVTYTNYYVTYTNYYVTYSNVYTNYYVTYSNVYTNYYVTYTNYYW